MPCCDAIQQVKPQAPDPNVTTCAFAKLIVAGIPNEHIVAFIAWQRSSLGNSHQKINFKAAYLLQRSMATTLMPRKSSFPVPRRGI